MIATDLAEVAVVEAMFCVVAELVFWCSSGAARVVSWRVSAGRTDSVFGAVVLAKDAGSSLLEVLWSWTGCCGLERQLPIKLYFIRECCEAQWQLR